MLDDPTFAAEMGALARDTITSGQDTSPGSNQATNVRVQAVVNQIGANSTADTRVVSPPPPR